jgi:hypothetical protein
VGFTGRRHPEFGGFALHPSKDTTFNDPIILKMPTLDVRGQIAAAQIAFYVPIAAATFALIYRYAFRRDAGWLFLCIFSLGEYNDGWSSNYSTHFTCTVRIAGGALLVAAELVVPSKIDLFIAAYILQPAGLAFLMLSTIGFLGLAYVDLSEC